MEAREAADEAGGQPARDTAPAARPQVVSLTALLAYIGHPAYGPDPVRANLDRFTFPSAAMTASTSSGKNSHNVKCRPQLALPRG
jgi:hypothetical protein